MKYQAHGDGDKNRPQIVEITKARYEAVRKAKTACLFAIELEEKFALLLDNFAELNLNFFALRNLGCSGPTVITLTICRNGLRWIDG